MERKSELSSDTSVIPIQSDAISNEFKDIMMENEILAKENRLFHAYLHRNLEGITEQNRGAVRTIPPTLSHLE